MYQSTKIVPSSSFAGSTGLLGPLVTLAMVNCLSRSSRVAEACRASRVATRSSLGRAEAVVWGLFRLDAEEEAVLAVTVLSSVFRFSNIASSDSGLLGRTSPWRVSTTGRDGSAFSGVGVAWLEL